jgi:ketosteroid isomerase-like protein
MTVDDSPSERIITAYFAAMRRGVAGERDLLALFHPDAVYEEPFSGEGPAAGVEAIRRRFRSGWESPLPDLEIDVLEIEVTGTGARSSWECRSPALPGPMRGEDRYSFRDGLIARLEVRMQAPGSD